MNDLHNQALSETDQSRVNHRWSHIRIALIKSKGLTRIRQNCLIPQTLQFLAAYFPKPAPRYLPDPSESRSVPGPTWSFPVPVLGRSLLQSISLLPTTAAGLLPSCWVQQVIGRAADRPGSRMTKNLPDYPLRTKRVSSWSLSEKSVLCPRNPCLHANVGQ